MSEHEPAPAAPAQRAPRSALAVGGVAVAIALVGGAVAFASADSGSDTESKTSTESSEPAARSMQLYITTGGATGWTLGDLSKGTSNGKPCTSTRGYDDIPGASVTVSDEAGKIVGVGTLPQQGEIVDGMYCEYTTNIYDLGPAQFYQLKISHRGAPTYSTAQLEATGWTVALKLY